MYICSSENHQKMALQDVTCIQYLVKREQKVDLSSTYCKCVYHSKNKT